MKTNTVCIIRKYPIQNGNFRFSKINKANKIFKINSKNFFEYFISTKDLDIDFMYYKVSIFIMFTMFIKKNLKYLCH